MAEDAIEIPIKRTRKIPDDAVVIEPKRRRKKPTEEAQKVEHIEQTSQRIPKPKEIQIKPIERPPQKAPKPKVPKKEVSKITIEKREKAKSIDDILSMQSKINISDVEKGISRIFQLNHRTRPSFSPSWVSLTKPSDRYKIRDNKKDKKSKAMAEINIYFIPEEAEGYYHISPKEYVLPTDEMKLIYLARTELIKHYPKNIQLNNPDQVREHVIREGKIIIDKLSEKHDVKIGDTIEERTKRVKELAEILAQYTAGLGVTEIILNHKEIQDVYIDAPASENSVYVEGDFKDKRLANKCKTNVILGEEDAEGLLSRFRYQSGRPFSEAMPVLETDLQTSMHKTRITVIGKPLSQKGIAMALRQHSRDPWTLLRLIQRGSISPITAGLISFLIDGKSTILVAGSRGAGKTSLLGAIMFEFPHTQRILTIEDTPELPIDELQKLGYKVQSMSVQSTLGGMGERTANDALLVSLRLGESAIVLGEVRGNEANTLFEAMRAGTAGSSVLGTIHGNSAQAVYERITGDKDIKPSVFSATDIIIVAGLIQPGGQQQRERKITQVTEIHKEISEDNNYLISFYDLVDNKTGIENIILDNSEKIQKIADDWQITYEEAIEDIRARAKCKEIIVNYVNENPAKEKLLTAKWVNRTNNYFRTKKEDVRNRYGTLDYDIVLKEWEDWFERNARLI